MAPHRRRYQKASGYGNSYIAVVDSYISPASIRSFRAWERILRQLVRSPVPVRSRLWIISWEAARGECSLGGGASRQRDRRRNAPQPRIQALHLVGVKPIVFRHSVSGLESFRKQNRHPSANWSKATSLKTIGRRHRKEYAQSFGPKNRNMGCQGARFTTLFSGTTSFATR